MSSPIDREVLKRLHESERELSIQRIRFAVAYMAIPLVLAFTAVDWVYSRENWRREFNIRIGVNSGYAHVGFFPSWEHGTYTAVGGGVNLASRLCAHAETNSICVTKRQFRKVAEQLSRAEVSTRDFVPNIKGFENEVFELFTIKPLLNAVLATPPK